MNKINKIINSFVPESDEKSEFLGDVCYKNFIRLRKIVPIAVLLALSHLITFYFQSFPEGSDEYYWQQSLIKAHAILMVYFIIIGLTSYVIHKKNNNEYNPHVQYRLFTHLTYVFLFGIAISLTIIDQAITTSISPLIIVSTLMPLLFNINPLINSLYLMTAYFVFMYLIGFYQDSDTILLSTAVNAFSAFIINFTLSALLWSHNLNSFRQSRIIEKQQNELSEKNRKLEFSEGELIKSNQTKDKFFSIIAHDLRNPIGGIKSYLNLLSHEFDSFSKKEVEEGLELMSSNADQVYYLLENLLEWSKTQRELIVTEYTKFDLNSLINNINSLFRIRASSKNIKLYNHVPKETSIIADLNLLNTIIRNLVSNAIKFTPDGGSIEITYSKDDNYHKISVIDSGVGMSEEILKSLFDAQHNSSSLGTNNEKGSGLGLLLVKELLLKMNGDISVGSVINKGSKFIVEIPVNLTINN